METRFYKTPKHLKPSADGARMLALKPGESMVIPWERCPSPRPKGPAVTGVGGIVLNMEPVEDGIKVTRIE